MLYITEFITPTKPNNNIHICIIFFDMLSISSRDIVVGIVTSYGLHDSGVGVRVSVGSRIFSSPCRPDRLWSPPNLLSSGYRGLFLRGLRGRSVKLTTHLQLVPRSRKYGSIRPLPHTHSWRSAQLVKHSDYFIFYNSTYIVT
jgi:hypothetical protein